MGRDGKTANERNVGWRAVLPLAQFGERVWWMPLQPSNRRLDLWIHDLNKVLGTDGWIEHGTYRHRKWCGEGPNNQTIAARRTMDWQLAGRSRVTPNALKDDGGRVGIRALVSQPHEAVPLPPSVSKFRQVRRPPLRRTDFKRFGCTDNCPGCANARAGRKQAVDPSEQCRSRMEAILSTTTEGHERLERARGRFAQVAKEPEDEEPQRKRHRHEGKGRQPLAPPASGVRSNYQEGAAVAAVQSCRLRHRLRHRHLNHHNLQNGAWNSRPK